MSMVVPGEVLSFRNEEIFGPKGPHNMRAQFRPSRDACVGQYALQV